MKPKHTRGSYKETKVLMMIVHAPGDYDDGEIGGMVTGKGN
jgi:hypothetical protein